MNNHYGTYISMESVAGPTTSPLNLEEWNSQVGGLAREYVQRQSRQPVPLPLPTLLEALESMILRESLRVCSGSQKLAAMRLGLKHTTLHEKIKRLGIEPKEIY